MRAAWLAVRRDYFPRWDRTGAWRFRISNLPGSCEGNCDWEKRTITVVYLYEDDDADERDMVLIHEICHAVAIHGHGPAWLRRMRRAADRAEELKRPLLAKMLREQADMYESAPKVSFRAQVYELMSDWTLQNPDLPYHALRKAVANDFACKPTELEHLCRRLRRVYEEAKRETLDYRQLHQEWDAQSKEQAAAKKRKS
jgi:hypothetical protein